MGYQHHDDQGTSISRMVPGGRAGRSRQPPSPRVQPPSRRVLGRGGHAAVKQAAAWRAAGKGARLSPVVNGYVRTYVRSICFLIEVYVRVLPSLIEVY